MTAKQFYTYIRPKFKQDGNESIENIMFDKVLLYYYFSRCNQSWNTPIKEYVRFLRQIRLNLFPDAPKVNKRVKYTGRLGERHYYQHFNPKHRSEYKVSVHRYTKDTK